MRHLKKNKKLNRTSSHRKSLVKNMAVSLIIHEQINTTLPKAKFVKPQLEKLVTLAKRGNLHARRQLISAIQSEEAVTKLIDVLAKRYSERPGGYLRILKNGFRYGDAAPMAIIEFVDRDISSKGSADIARHKAQAEQKYDTTQEYSAA